MDKERRGWPGYLFNGRIRTSTVALIVAFIVAWWLYEAYQPPPKAPQAPATQVVPPGFVPDPAYTWVPRTSVRERTTTIPTTTTTTTTSPTPTPAGTSAPTSPTPTTTTPPAGVPPLPGLIPAPPGPGEPAPPVSPG